MTGIGGGSLMTPMLGLVFGVRPTTAIGTDLAYAAVTKTVGGYKHWTQKTVDLTISSIALLLTGAATLVRAFLKRMHERDTIEMERRHKKDFGLAGMILLGSVPGVWLGSLPIAVIVPFSLGVVALLVVTMVRSPRARAEVGA